MSERPSTGWPCACSGDRYDAVPRIAAVCATVSAVVVTRAMPKSVTFTSPRGFSMMLPGLMSRWITPCACAASSALAHVHRDVDRAVGQDAAAAGQELGERATLDVLHHDVVHAVVRAGVEDRDDVRVPDARGGLRLAAEALHEAVVVGELRREDLHGDGPTQHRVRAEEDLGHAAAAELALDAVAPSEGHRQVDLRNLLLTRPVRPRGPPSRSGRRPARPSPRCQGYRRRAR